ncbi:TonB-dependent Receptor Plug Domain [Colwellia chukchiensis]|uniref:TonB-dependent Receptor Plug Domain n=1 Tax=Colwellia chukchiensis TaxID=641665 RepID=A0A1H7GKJ4_9GAMM|nr:TonB-dependent receptor [Colwellia chukchiensis]SEK38621.1 TonB-dependent Receptor Plug Domain [Colwellia chukchiensis]
MYQSNKLTKAVRLALVAGATTTALAAPAAMAFADEAAAEDKGVERIQVTGSRIRRSELTAVTPIIEIDAQEFAISGNLNIEQKLAELPSTLPSFGPSSNNPGDGTATVDLRGLGTSRTLVMVNGRRWVPSNQSGVVDLNTIPASLIENVEIITGGASAVYGSDAIGGVVNFKMKDDFEGVEISTLYDVTTENDAEKFNLDLTMGGNFADDRGNAVLYIGYSKREALFQGDRAFSDKALTEGADGLIAGGSSGIPGTRVFGGPTLPNGDNLGRFLPDGSGAPFTGADRFNYAPDNFLQLPQERLTMSAFSHFYINDETRIYSEISFIRNEVPQELAPTPAFTTIEVNPNSAFFAPDVQQAMLNSGDLNADGNYEMFVGRRMVENGPRQAIDTRDAMRILVGIDGYINDDWSYDVYYSRAQMDQSNLLNNDVSASRFKQALLVNDAATACQDTSGGCVPLNIFGEGNISDEAVGFVNVGAANITSIKQEVFMATVSGSLPFTFPGADEPVGVVFGYEKRQDESSFRPDEFLSAGDVLGFNAGQATVGSYASDELFTEFSLPLMSGKDFAEDLSLWGAARFADYSNIGQVSSFAAALNWAPTDWVSTRIGFQSAVRAPNVSELFLGAANGFPGATDPCAVDGYQPGVTSDALCLADGVAADQIGVFEQANGQIEGSFGGNENLTEETSDTFTVGIVVQPFEGLDFTIDYFSIEIEDAISSYGVNNTLNVCYNIVKDANHETCKNITRRADGNVDIVQSLNANIASIETTGVDFNVTYNKELDFGLFGDGSDLNVQFRSTFLEKSDFVPIVGLDTKYECAGYYGNTCGAPQPDFQANTRINWTNGDLTLSALVRYIGASDDDQLMVDSDLAKSDLIVPEIDSALYVDISASYVFSENLNMNFGIKNVFDEEPTALGDSQQQANTFPETYDVIGPRVFVSASYTFD